MDLGFFKTIRRLLILGILLGVFFALLTPGTKPARAATGTNQTINFQGRLLTSSGAAVPDGFYNIQFKIYQDGDGQSVGDTTGSPTGSLKWTESYLNSASHGVRVFNGYMSVQLGSVTPFGGSVDWNQDTLWLSMNIGNTNVSCTPFTSCSPDGEMTPMQPLTSAVYALNAGQLGGLTAAAFGQLAASQTWTAANIFQPTGNVTGVKVIQSSAGAPTADIFNVQSANNTNLIQVTGSSANNAAITLRSLGGTNAITLNSAGALNFTGAAASVWDIGGSTLSLQTTNNGAITTGSGLLTVGGSQTFSGANPVISTSTTNTNLTVQTNGTGTVTINTTGAGTVNVGTTNTTTVGIGNNGSTTAVTTTGGATAQTISNTGELIKTSTNSATAFQVQNSSNVAALLVDTTTQRVGIGTTAPGSALEVNGDIYLTKEAARTIKVDASTTASTAGGALTITAGTGNAAAGGALNLNGGTAINSTGAGGNVNITAGAAASGSFNAGGNVVITSGGGLTAGTISLQTANFSSTYGNTSINTSGGKVLIGSANNGFQVDTNQNIRVNGSNITAGSLATPVISTASTGTNFYYGITAVNGQGETVLSNTVGMASSSATINWAAIPGATSYKIYRNTTNSFSSGSLFRTSTSNGLIVSFTDDGTATTAGLPPTTVTGTKLTVQGWGSQTGDLQQWLNSAGSVLANVTAAGLLQAQSGLEVASTGTVGTVEKFRVNTPTTVDNLANAIISTSATTSKGLVIQGTASQTASLQEWQASDGQILAKIGQTGNLTIGTTAAGSANTAGTLSLQGYYNTSGGTFLNISAGGSNPYIIGSGTGNQLILGSGSGLQFCTTASCTTALGRWTNTGSLRIGDAVVAGAMLDVKVQSAAVKGLIVGGATAQTADLQQYQDVNGAVLSKVGANGAITTNGVTNTFGNLLVPTIGSTSTAATGGTLAQNTTYWYQMTATNAAGETVGSASVSRLTGNTTATNTITLNWTQIAGATGYKVYRNTSNVFNSGSLLLTTITNGTTITYLDTGSATGAGLPPTAPTGTKTVVQGWASQTANVFEVQSSSGSNILAAASTGGITVAGTITIQNGNGISSTGDFSGSTTLTDFIGATAQLGVNPAAAGAVRLANTGAINWRNAANSADILGVTVTGSNVLQLAAAVTTNDTTATASIGTTGTAKKGLVIQGVASQSANLQEWQNSSGTALASIDQSGNLAAGTINTNTFGASALTFSGANPVISASTTNTGLTVQANGTGTLNLNTTGAGTVNLGTANATTVAVGNSTAGTTTTITGGTSSTAVSIVSGAGGTIRVGDNGVASTVQIGNTTGAVTQTVNIGTNPTASSQTNVTIGSTIGASVTTIISGTGNLNLQTQGTGNLNVGANAIAQNIIIGNSTGGTNVSINCGTGTCGLGTNATDHSTTVGSTTGTSLTTIQSGSGGISLNGAVSTSGAINGITLSASALTFSGANPVISASTTNTGVTLQSNGTGTLTLNSSGAGTVNVGTTNTTTVGIGNSTAATTVTSTAGATVQTVANTGLTVKTNTNSISALQVKDSSNNVAFNVDTVTGAVGTVSTSTASTASRALLLQSGATTGTTSNSGDVTLQSGGASTSGSSGTVAIKTGDVGLGNSGSITLDVGSASSGSVGTIAIGGVNALSTTIGRSSGTSAVTLQTGTGNLTLQTQGTGSILIGNNAVAQTIAIGNSTGATTVGISCGTGSCGFGDNAVAHATTVGSATGNASTTIQSGTGNLSIQSQGTGTLGVGNNAVAQTINIGNATGATTVAILCGTGTCGFGDNAVAHATTVGSATGNASTTIQSGTGNLSIQSQGTGTLGVGNNAVAQTIVIGNSTGGTSVAINCGTGDCTLGNNATDHSTTVGSGAGVSVTTIQGGSGGVVINSNTAINGTINTNTLTASALTFSGANPVISASTTNTNMTVQSNGTGTLTLNSSGAGTVNVGTTNTTTVGIGNNTAATSTTITGGTGANAVSIQTGTGGTISLGTTGIASTIQIGTTTAVATQTIGIGNNATATSVNNIAIGNLLGSSNTLVQGGTGASAIVLAQGTGGGVVIGTTGAGSTVSIQCGAGTSTSCGFANNATDHTTTVGSISGTSVTNIQSGSGGIGLNGNTSITGTLSTTGTINGDTLSTTALTFTGASPVISTTSTNSGFTLQANGTGTLTLNTSGSGTVNVGTTNTTTVAVGNTGAGTTVTLTGGATTTTVANAGTTVKTSTNSSTALQVQNAAGAAILAVNTSTPQVAFTATAVNAVNGTPLVNTSYTSTNTTAGTETAQNITVSDTGVVTSGTETTNGLNLSVTHTGQTGGTIASNGINLQVNMDNAGAGTSTGNGIYSLVTGSADTVTGVGGGYLASGTANTGTATGIQGSVGTLFFSGTVANAIGVGANVSSTGGTGTLTNGYGVQVTSATVLGGGSIGANYGIQVQPQTVGTTNYGVVIGTATTQTLQVGYDADGTTANAGISFGATTGTAANLYRGADNQLKTDSSLLVKTTTNSTSALSVQTSGGVNVFAVDTVNSTVGTVKTTTASTDSQALTLQSGTVVGTGSNSGNTTLQSGASTVSGNTGTVSVTSGNANSGNSGTVSVDVGTASGTRGGLNLGATNAQNINVGNTTGSTTVSIMGGSGGISAKATGTTAFQVQNASGVSVLTVDTTNRQLKVMENAGSTNYALIYYDTATSTANYTASSGTVAVGTGAGSISIQAGTASAIAITANAASLWRTTVGTLTLQSGTNSNLVLTPSGTGMATISGSAKFVLGQSAGDPGTCTVGALVYNTTTNALRGCQGSTPTWNDIINVTTPTTQATYTASTGGATAEIKLDTTRGAMDIQGDNAGAVTDLFNIRAGTGSGLGQSLLGVNSSGDVTIQSSAGIAELATTSTDVSIGQGSTGHSTNPVVLVLDNYQPITAGGAPTQQDGAMYYNADQNIFMCGLNGTWTNCAINSIQSSYVFEDEFLGGTTSAATGTSFQGVGALGWNMNATTSCAVAYNQTGPTLTHDHPGTLRLTTGGANGNGCAMTQAGTAAGTATLSQIIGAGDVFKTNIAIGAQTGTMRVGWTNQTSNTAPTSGAWWEYVNGSDATHLRYCYANNGGASCAAGPVIAANAWAELEIYINSSSNITFVTNINGTTTTVTTTGAFDTGATNKLGPTTTCYASSATPLNCYVDYIQWSGVNTSTRGIRD